MWVAQVRQVEVVGEGTEGHAVGIVHLVDVLDKLANNVDVFVGGLRTIDVLPHVDERDGLQRHHPACIFSIDHIVDVR